MTIPFVPRVGRAVTGMLLAPLLILGVGCANPAGYRLARTPRPTIACDKASTPARGLAAERNHESLYATPVDLFGRPEKGWAVYAPAIESQIHTDCAADTPGFADALAHWSGTGAADGVLGPEALARLKGDWQAQRPFVMLRTRGVCPPPPPSADLADAPPTLAYGGKAIQLRRGALAAWTRLVHDARSAEPELAANGELLRIFSAFRSPAYDDARCAHDQNCQGTVRAACSAHRTGLAMDVVLDTAPGFAVDSSADENRLAMTRGLAYRWLVANAGRYGFVNYVFEPWHWEWTGAPP